MPGRPSGAKDSHKRASRQQKTASEYLKLAQIAEAKESKEKWWPAGYLIMNLKKKEILSLTVVKVH